MTAELHTFAGTYTLDGLSGPEDDDFERHLAGCQICRQEVRGFRETAALLAVAVSVRPPAPMRDEILDGITRIRQEPPEVPADRAAGRLPARWRTRAAVLAAAAAVAAVIGVGVHDLSTQRQLDASRRDEAAVSAVLAAPDATTARPLPAPAGAAGMTVVSSPSRHTVVVLATGLPTLDRAHSYQVWLIGAGTPASAGVLRPAGDRPQPLVSPIPAGANEVGVTVEPAGGSPAPTTSPIMLFSLT